MIDMRAREATTKSLEVLFTADDKIRDFRFVSNVTPIPANAVGGTVIAPIVIPRPN